MSEPEDVERRLREAGMLADARADARAIDAAEEDAALTRAGAAEVCRERDIAQAQARANQDLYEVEREDNGILKRQRDEIRKALGCDPKSESTVAAAYRVARELQQAKEALEQARAKEHEACLRAAALGGQVAGANAGIRLARERGAAEMRERAAARLRGLGWRELAELVATIPLSPEPQAQPDEATAGTLTTEPWSGRRVRATAIALEQLGFPVERAKQAAVIAEEEGGSAPEVAHSAVLRLAKRGLLLESTADEFTRAEFRRYIRAMVAGYTAARKQGAAPDGLSAEDAETLRGDDWGQQSDDLWFKAHVRGCDPMDHGLFDAQKPGGLKALRERAARIRSLKAPAAAHGEPERLTGEVTAAAGSSSVAPTGGAAQGEPVGRVPETFELTSGAWCVCADASAPRPGQLIGLCGACDKYRAFTEAPLHPASAPHGLPKPPRVEVGQRWRSVNVQPELVVREVNGAREVTSRAPAHPYREVLARESFMLTSDTWSFLGPAPQGPTGGGEPEKSEPAAAAETAPLEPTARDAVAGMLLRLDFRDAARDLLRGEAPATLANLLRSLPVAEDDRPAWRACIAALEALDRGELSAPRHAGNLVAAIDRLTNARDEARAAAGKMAIDREDAIADMLKSERLLAEARAEANAEREYAARLKEERDAARDRAIDLEAERDRIQREREQQGARLHELESAQSAGRGGADVTWRRASEVETPALAHLLGLLELQPDVSIDRVFEVAGHEIEDLRAEDEAPDGDRVTAHAVPSGVQVSWRRGLDPDLIATDVAWLAQAPGARPASSTQVLHSGPAGVRLVIAKGADPREVLATVAELLGLSTSDAETMPRVEAIRAADLLVQAERERQQATARGLAEKWEKLSNRMVERCDADGERGYDLGAARYAGRHCGVTWCLRDIRAAFGLTPPDGGPGGGETSEGAEAGPARPTVAQLQAEIMGWREVTGCSDPELVPLKRRGDSEADARAAYQRGREDGLAEAQRTKEAPVSSPTSDVGGLDRDTALRLASDWATAATAAKLRNTYLGDGEAAGLQTAASELRVALGLEPAEIKVSIWRPTFNEPHGSQRLVGVAGVPMAHKEAAATVGTILDAVAPQDVGVACARCGSTRERAQELAERWRGRSKEPAMASPISATLAMCAFELSEAFGLDPEGVDHEPADTEPPSDPLEPYRAKASPEQRAACLHPPDVRMPLSGDGWLCGLCGADCARPEALAAPDREALGREVHEALEKALGDIEPDEDRTVYAWAELGASEQEIMCRTGERLFAMGVKHGADDGQRVAGELRRTKESLRQAREAAEMRGRRASELERELDRLRADMRVANLELRDARGLATRVNELVIERDRAHEAGVAKGLEMANGTSAGFGGSSTPAPTPQDGSSAIRSADTGLPAGEWKADAAPSRWRDGCWCVEIIEVATGGVVGATLFDGIRAEERARAYARWISGTAPLETQVPTPGETTAAEEARRGFARDIVGRLHARKVDHVERFYAAEDSAGLNYHDGMAAGLFMAIDMICTAAGIEPPPSAPQGPSSPEDPQTTTATNDALAEAVARGSLVPADPGSPAWRSSSPSTPRARWGWWAMAPRRRALLVDWLGSSSSDADCVVSAVMVRAACLLLAEGQQVWWSHDAGDRARLVSWLEAQRPSVGGEEIGGALLASACDALRGRTLDGDVPLGPGGTPEPGAQDGSSEPQAHDSATIGGVKVGVDMAAGPSRCAAVVIKNGVALITFEGPDCDKQASAWIDGRGEKPSPALERVEVGVCRNPDCEHDSWTMTPDGLCVCGARLGPAHKAFGSFATASVHSTGSVGNVSPVFAEVRARAAWRALGAAAAAQGPTAIPETPDPAKALADAIGEALFQKALDSVDILSDERQDALRDDLRSTALSVLLRASPGPTVSQRSKVAAKLNVLDAILDESVADADLPRGRIPAARRLVAQLIELVDQSGPGGSEPPEPSPAPSTRPEVDTATRRHEASRSVAQHETAVNAPAPDAPRWRGLEHEAMPHSWNDRTWVVSAHLAGEQFYTRFEGPDAEARAKEYTAFVSAGDPPPRTLPADCRCADPGPIVWASPGEPGTCSACGGLRCGPRELARDPAPLARVEVGQRWRRKATGEVWTVKSVRADSVKMFNGVYGDVFPSWDFRAQYGWEFVDGGDDQPKEGVK